MTQLTQKMTARGTNERECAATAQTDKELKELLDGAVARINVPGFVADDPVQFPRRFEALQDVETVALLSAIMAWGRRPMILRDCERLLVLMEGSPCEYVMSGSWEELPDRLNIHRTMFASHLKYMLRGLREVYCKYGSLEAFCAACVPQGAEAAPWIFGESLRRLLADVNGGAGCSECLPTRMDTTALKRVNMALRWLVRDDGVVDMGLWKCLKPSQLYVPLDVHVGNVSRSLGLLSRRANDRKAVEQLTASLRLYDPADPVKYDFALFGLGVTGQLAD